MSIASTALKKDTIPEPIAKPPHAAAMLEHVSFTYDAGASWALRDVTLSILPGERVCLVGPNGSGKSTLARILAGLVAPDAGLVCLQDHAVYGPDGADADAYRRARRGIGAVFQNPEDQIVTTVVADDVAFGPENLGVEREEIGRRILRSLDAVDMRGHDDHDPTRMSGGQQQRVAIAGTLAMRPGMIVLDEPTAMLDATARREVIRVLDNLQNHGTTIIHVTHRPDETMPADHIIHLDRGHIVQDELVEPEHAHASRDSAIHTSNGSNIPLIYDVDDVHDLPACNSPAPGENARPATRYVDAATAPPDNAHGSDGPVLVSPTEPAISVNHVSMRYPDVQEPAISNLSFEVAKGETVAIMGRNGSGKSTLARLLCALEQPNAGSIQVAGIALNRRTRRNRTLLRRRVGFVMQHPERQLFANTVAQDIAYGPKNQRLTDDEVTHRVDTALDLLHISHLADRSPFALSGGQQRLAAIAGVIACEPSVLVMDEPTAGLDAAASGRIYELIRAMQRQHATIVIVTHSAEEARLLADRVITMPQGRASETARGRRNAGVRTDLPNLPDMQERDGAATVNSQTPSNTHRAAEPNAANEANPAEAAGTSRDTDHEGVSRLMPAARTPMPSMDAQPRVSTVARLDPRVKLVAFLALMFTAFIVDSPQRLALTACMVAVIMVAARLNPLRVLASVHMFLALFVMIGLLNVFFVRSGPPLLTVGTFRITMDGVAIGLLYICRFALVVILGAILLATTTPTSLTDGFGSLLSPLNVFGLHTQEFALVMSLALRFLPTLGDEAKSIMDAQAARGGSIETGSPVRRIRAMTAIIVPVLAGTLRHADNLSLALDARCYEEGVRRTHWRTLRIRAADMTFCALALAYIAVLLAL